MCGRLLKLLASDFDVTQQDERNYCRWTTMGLPGQANYRLWTPDRTTKEVQNHQDVLACRASNIKNIYQCPGMPVHGHVKSEFPNQHAECQFLLRRQPYPFTVCLQSKGTADALDLRRPWGRSCESVSLESQRIFEGLTWKPSSCVRLGTPVKIAP